MHDSTLSLDLTQLFCDIDDLCSRWQRHLRSIPQLPSADPITPSRSRLALSEVATIVVAFHASGYRTFKDFYTRKVLPDWSSEFPNLVSYSRFVELMPRSVIPLIWCLHSRFGADTGISFIDSTPLAVCHRYRARQHRVFSEELVGWGKNGMGWYFGFKLHLVLNDCGELLACALTPGNTDDRKPVPDLVKDLVGRLFGDGGYISQKLFEQLWERGLKLVTTCRRNMKPRLQVLEDKLLLRKRSLIETVNDQLKNISQIEHSRHRSVFNFLANLVGGLVAYSYQPKKPSLHLSKNEKMLLQSAF